MNDSLLPHQFRQKAVNRYAPFIAEVLKRWPGPVTFDPTPLGVETFSNRFRDACAAIMSKGKEHELVPRAKLAAVYDSLVTRVRDGTIIIGDKNSTKILTEKATALPIVSTTTAFLGTLEWTQEPELAAAALLLSKRILTSPFKIVGVPNETLRLSMLSFFDVAFEPIDATSTLML